MLTYDVILQGEEATEEYALYFARCFDFVEVETKDETCYHYDYIDTINGVEIYYQYRADYYFFAPDNEDSSRARFNLDNREDRDAFRLHCIEQISESEKTWSDVAALHALSYKEYFGACIDENGALYNSASHDPEDLLVSAEQFCLADEMFLKIMKQCKDDYFQEQ